MTDHKSRLSSCSGNPACDSGNMRSLSSTTTTPEALSAIGLSRMTRRESRPTEADLRRQIVTTSVALVTTSFLLLLVRHLLLLAWHLLLLASFYICLYDVMTSILCVVMAKVRGRQIRKRSIFRVLFVNRPTREFRVRKFKPVILNVVRFRKVWRWHLD